jgi:hypothetical protein
MMPSQTEAISEWNSVMLSFDVKRAMEVPLVRQQQTSNEPPVDGFGDDRVKTPEVGSRSVATSSSMYRIADALERIADSLASMNEGHLDVRVR